MTKKEQLLRLTKHIPDPVVRAFTVYCLEEAPWHFWWKPSSAGKYHPSDEHDYEGLVLHSIRVVNVGLVICDSAEGRLNPNIILPACFKHDICRYGDGEAFAQYSVPEHPELAANLIRKLGNGSGQFVNAIADAVETHTGRWGKTAPRNETEWAVHYADCIAANYHKWESA